MAADRTGEDGKLIKPLLNQLDVEKVKGFIKTSYSLKIALTHFCTTVKNINVQNPGVVSDASKEIKGQLKGLRYSVDDAPAWHLSCLFGLQVRRPSYVQYVD